MSNSDDIICSCFDITYGAVRDAVKNGATTLKEVQDETQAGTLCGACLDDLERFIEEVKAE